MRTRHELRRSTRGGREGGCHHLLPLFDASVALHHLQASRENALKGKVTAKAGHLDGSVAPRNRRLRRRQIGLQDSVVDGFQLT